MPRAILAQKLHTGVGLPLLSRIPFVFFVHTQQFCYFIWVEHIMHAGLEPAWLEPAWLAPGLDAAGLFDSPCPSLMLVVPFTSSPSSGFCGSGVSLG